jgi:Biotin/lipoate A/B protein ligase family
MAHVEFDMSHVDKVQAAAGVSLLGEGFEMIDTDAIISSFARHLMTAFDRWNEHGFEAIARDYLERLPRCKAAERRSIDLNGDLLVNLPASGGPDRSSLVDALAKVDWYDPNARGPKLG